MENSAKVTSRNNNQARKFCSIRITGFSYFYFTVRVVMNNSLVPSFHWKGYDHLYKGND